MVGKFAISIILWHLQILNAVWLRAVLMYLHFKTNVKHTFRIDMQLYQHSWKLEKLEIGWEHIALHGSVVF